MNKRTILFISFAVMAVMLMSDACFAQDATQAVAAEPSWAEKLYYWFKDHMNYWTVLVLMAIESSLYFSLRACASLSPSSHHTLVSEYFLRYI